MRRKIVLGKNISPSHRLCFKKAAAFAAENQRCAWDYSCTSFRLQKGRRICGGKSYSTRAAQQKENKLQKGRRICGGKSRKANSDLTAIRRASKRPPHLRRKIAFLQRKNGDFAAASKRPPHLRRKIRRVLGCKHTEIMLQKGRRICGGKSHRFLTWFISVRPLQKGRRICGGKSRYSCDRRQVCESFKKAAAFAAENHY